MTFVQSEAECHEDGKMGKRCEDTGCPYLAADGTCLLPEHDLREKCPAREQIEYKGSEDWTGINVSDYSGFY